MKPGSGIKKAAQREFETTDASGKSLRGSSSHHGARHGWVARREANARQLKIQDCLLVGVVLFVEESLGDFLVIRVETYLPPGIAVLRVENAADALKHAESHLHNLHEDEDY